jgi:branched-chain amino acid transport system substrate-binding protein
MKRSLVGTLAVVAMVGCGPAPKQKTTITFGAVLSVTGDLAAIGSEQLDAAKLAAEQITAAGGLLGSDLVIENKDDATDAAKAATAAQALVAEKVPVIIGAVGSSFSLAVNQVAADAGVVQLSASSTSPLLTTAPDNGTLFRTCASDALQAKLLAKRAKAKGFTKVATVYVPGAYGKGLSDTFDTEFTAAGGTTTIKKEYTTGQASYTALLTEVFATNPEAIVLIGYPVDSAQIIKDYLQTFSAKDTFWYFPDALEDSGFVTAVGSAFTFQHEGTGPSTPSGATFDAFKSAFTTKYGKAPSPGTYSAHAYDAVYLAALAAAAAGSADGAAIKAKIVPVSAGGTAVTAADFKQAATDAAAGTDIDYVGASGSVDMDANGDVVTNYDTWKVNGTAITVTASGLAP